MGMGRTVSDWLPKCLGSLLCGWGMALLAGCDALLGSDVPLALVGTWRYRAAQVNGAPVDLYRGQSATWTFTQDNDPGQVPSGRFVIRVGGAVDSQGAWQQVAPNQIRLNDGRNTLTVTWSVTGAQLVLEYTQQNNRVAILLERQS
ncbi:MAG: hypothetical protein N2561_01830 [Bacteroidetes bacterium]|nr:hypothetical protein [Rhodothermia bacterium]MCS7154543.1 hypothetical protein [Bacteroidota bacterium]MCX7906260.1 hypothetical protein [Bacteroidota bacterium]MDW8285710.1 hypothetical protein [Bacteroidota bacterium]